ncbi:ABC1 kinase family protein [Alloalcanivorax mobilis]|mgnify:CR=1 FL=1|uniref:ABC1 kinase family protein n=1 Tax=Alloalcanivorax mobilis TaxID=2019569 RepID=UPI000B5B3761|nr:AarF/UbiB family protein [Alloalcanivorax mobilis]ASK33926.1 ABC transporter [Alcanivorax sp. N3-2A]|tara:strand:+ start:43484 stop:45148 length:1665 start_codon:yes stop_codon:yes gene_type:complete
MSLLHTGKDLRRLNQVAGILLKYGFTDVLRRVGLATPVEQAGRLMRHGGESRFLRMGTAERLRHALEEMGPTYVKLGQLLATRVDLFPPDWIAEFEQLQDRATALPFAALRPGLEATLGEPLNRLFSYVDETPVGVASIGQVHAAITLTGQRVVLKIRKPGIAAMIESDLRLLDQLAKLASDNSVELRRYRPVELVREFRRSLMRELDFTIEARNASRIRKNLRGFKWLIVPRVIWQYSSDSLQVQERIEGIPARALGQLDAAGLDRALIARRGATLAWKMALEDGFFHADPHPGNFLILPGNRIAMLDFGMVGKLSDGRREQIVRLVRAIITREPEQGAAVLSAWSDGQPVNFEQLVADVEDVISRYYGLPLAELDISALIGDITALVRNHGLVLPSDIALLLKTLITLEGFGRLLNPGFDLIEEARPLMQRLVRHRYSPRRLARNLGLRALDVVDRAYAPPDPPGAVRPGADSGLDPRHLERLVARLERGQYRQIQALLVISGILSGTILLAARVPPAPWGISALGVLVLLGAGVWSTWLLWVSRRHLREWE